ncbi:hypothetical protein V1460_17135 [Streptomyces sp. SCSIO 30461]|uniref:hypothetical protein n=1 Tax=Streptomyces sp. SCSIO 30461 TaxID=3118085 RepID=UPI0030D39BC3
MDSAAPYLTSQASASASGQVIGLVSGIVHTIGWVITYLQAEAKELDNEILALVRRQAP